MNCLQRMSKSQLNGLLQREQAKVSYSTFQRHLYLAVEILGTVYDWTPVQIQDFLNRMMNNYECLANGYGNIDDTIDLCWNEYGFKFENGKMITKETDNDLEIQKEILRKYGEEIV